MKTLYTLLAFSLQIMVFAQIPTQWHSRGIGGGGALFAPAINPLNTEEYYVACDMGELFHTTDFGLSYSNVDFTEFLAFNNSKVLFTSTPGLLYAINYRTDIPQVAKSIDNGQSWDNVPGNLEWEEVYALFVDYHHPEILVTNFWSSILVSDDSGNTFTTVYETEIGAGAHLAGVFFDYPNIFIGLNEGLLVSHDGGGSFAFEDFPGIADGQGFYSFAGAKQNDTVRLMGATAPVDDFWNGMPSTDYWEMIDAVYRLDYGSDNWGLAVSGINFGFDYPMLLAMADNDISTAYLAGSDAEGFPSVLKTTNGGNSWQHVFLTGNNQNIITGWSGDGGDHHWWYPEIILGIDVARFNPDVVVVTDLGTVHKTGDGGNLWQQAYVSVADQHPAGGPTPKNQDYHSIGIENTSAWCMVWSDEDNIFTGFSDISGLRSKDGGTGWSFDYSGHDQNTMYWAVKHPVSGIIYAATSTVHDIYQSYRLRDSEIEYGGSGGTVIFSEDGGANWEVMHDFEMPVYWVALDPNDPEKLYASVINHSAGFGGIWATEDISAGASSTWDKIANPARTQGHPASIIVLDDGKVLTSWSARRNTAGQFTNSSGVFLYDPVNGNWEDLTHPNMVYWTKDIVVDPADPLQDTWYAGVFSGWGGPANDKGGLYRTFDRGQNWERIWETHRVESCSFNPLNHDEIYVTTETEGLWHSININDASPDFNRVDNYNFMHPLRVIFNPYENSETWIVSFGNGMKVGSAGNPPAQQIIELAEGWSGISSYLIPSNQSLESIFDDIENDLVFLYNFDGFYWPGENVNTLGGWNPNSGYAIKMASGAALTIFGDTNPDTDVELNATVSFLHIPTECGISTDELLQQLGENLIMVQEVATAKVYLPSYSINQIGQLIAGKAYFVTIANPPAMILFPECGGDDNTGFKD